MWRYKIHNPQTWWLDVKFTSCNWSCNWNWEKESCWLWCRNNIDLESCTTEEFFSDRLFWKYNTIYWNGTEEEYKRIIKDIMEDLY